MEQAHYFVSSVEAFVEDKKLLHRPRALVSAQGVFHAFEDKPEIRKLFLAGQALMVNIDGIQMKARLVREAAREGIHYNLRLLPTSEEAEARLSAQMKTSGFSSPWKRQFPRLSTRNVLPDIEMPATVVYTRLVGKTVGTVLNFSVHGLMFQIPCLPGSMGETVDQKAELQIVTNRGKLLDAWVRIARIYDEMVGPKKMERGLGVIFSNMPKGDRAYYNGLLLDVAEELKG